MKSIGVLGGIGPQATWTFEQRVHEFAQQRIPPKYNEGYPPLVSVYVRHPPVLVKDGRPTSPLTLDPRFLEAARKLGEWVDLIAIPSNTPHFFVDELAAAAGCPIVSIVDVTVAEIQRRGGGEVGLLGLGVPAVYARRLEEEGIAFRTAAEATRKRLDAAILRLMEGREDTDDRAAADGAVAGLREQGVGTIILGCSEIPLLVTEWTDDMIDPAKLLAEEVVRRALDVDGAPD